MWGALQRLSEHRPAGHSPHLPGLSPHCSPTSDQQDLSSESGQVQRAVFHQPPATPGLYDGTNHSITSSHFGADSNPQASRTPVSQIHPFLEVLYTPPQPQVSPLTVCITPGRQASWETKPPRGFGIFPLAAERRLRHSFAHRLQIFSSCQSS